MKSGFFLILAVFSLILAVSSTLAQEASKELTSKLYSLNVSGAPASTVLQMIAQKSGLALQLEGDLSKRVSYNFSDTTVENALTRMASDLGFEYSIRDGLLSVTKAVQKTGSEAKASYSPRLIELRYADADEIAQKVKTQLAAGEEIHVDKKLNTLVIMSSESSYTRAKKFIDLFDRMPKQILIEGKIVEASDEFSRSIGFQAGDLTDPSMDNKSRITGLSTPSVASSPNLRLKYKMGIVNNRNLDLRLIAAESKGSAKVISKPRVVTINNMRALVNSGLVFNVKTLSTVAASGSGTSSVATGGIERVEAGLQLGVMPTIVADSLIKLMIDVDNSEPTSTTVDGIPGISKNSANTSIIVPDGNTAVIAGLIKQQSSKGRTGVPFLSDIPILGLLFRADSKDNRNNELMIFITPRILQNPSDLPNEPEPDPEKMAASRTP